MKVQQPKIPASVHFFVGQQFGLPTKEVKKLYSPQFLNRARELDPKNHKSAVTRIIDWFSKSNAFGDPINLLCEQAKQGIRWKSDPGLLVVDLPMVLEKDFQPGSPINALDFGSGYGLSTYSSGSILNDMRLQFKIRGVDIRQQLIDHSIKGKYTEEQLYFGIFSPDSKKVQALHWENARKYLANQYTGGDRTIVEKIINQFSSKYRNIGLERMLLPQTIDLEDGFKHFKLNFKENVTFQKIAPFDFSSLGDFDIGFAQTVFPMFTREGQLLTLKGLSSVLDRYLVVNLADTSPVEGVGIPRDIIKSSGFEILRDGILQKKDKRTNFDMKAQASESKPSKATTQSQPVASVT